MTISLAWPLLQPDGDRYLSRNFVDHRKPLLLCGFVAVYPVLGSGVETVKTTKFFFAFCFDAVGCITSSVILVERWIE